MTTPKEDLENFSPLDVSKALSDFNNRIMKNYEQYKDTDLHPMYLWSKGEIDFKTQVEMLSEQLQSNAKPTIDRFVEELYGIELLPYQRSLLINIYNSNGNLYCSNRKSGNKILVEGIKAYRKKYDF